MKNRYKCLNVDIKLVSIYSLNSFNTHDTFPRSGFISPPTSAFDGTVLFSAKITSENTAMP